MIHNKFQEIIIYSHTTQSPFPPVHCDDAAQFPPPLFGATTCLPSLLADSDGQRDMRLETEGAKILQQRDGHHIRGGTTEEGPVEKDKREQSMLGIRDHQCSVYATSLGVCSSTQITWHGTRCCQSTVLLMLRWRTRQCTQITQAPREVHYLGRSVHGARTSCFPDDANVGGAFPPDRTTPHIKNVTGANFGYVVPFLKHI